MVLRSGIDVVSIAEVPWPDVEQVFGTRGDPARCWCQYFKMPNAQWWESPKEEKAGLLRAQTQANDPPPGMIAYRDGEPVGWVAVEPRQRYPGILRSMVAAESAEPHDDPAVWAISCFVVRIGFRKRGIGLALVAAAVDWAQQNGARVIEGYPVDVLAKPGSSSASLYHGTVSLFESAGFSEVARPTPSRVLMRLECAG